MNNEFLRLVDAVYYIILKSPFLPIVGLNSFVLDTFQEPPVGRGESVFPPH